MAEKSVIHVNKNSATTVDFDLAVEGVENGSTKAMLVIENVLSGCDVSIAATHKDGKWSVTIPNLKNFKESEYNVHLDVIVDGYYFTPVSGKIKLVDEPVIEVMTDEPSAIIEESLEQAKADMPTTVGDNTSEEGAELAAEVNSPPSGDALAINDRSTKDDAKHDAINAEKIKQIASSVSRTQGPQLPFDEDDLKEAAKATAKRALSEMMPILKNKPAVSSDKGTLLKPITPKRDLAKDNAVREALGLPARKKSR